MNILKNDKPLVEVFGQRPGRFKLALKGAEQAGVNSKSNVLEVGCACGDASVLIARTFGCKVTGVDASGDIIKKALKKNSITSRNVDFFVADVRNLPFSDRHFDFILSEAAFSLLGDKKKAVEEYYRVLANKGKVIINDFFLKTRVTEDVQNIVDYIPCFYEAKTAYEYFEVFREKGFQKIYFQEHYAEIIKTSFWLCKAYGVSARDLGQLLFRLLGSGNNCNCLQNNKRFFKEAKLSYGQFIFIKD